MKLNFLATFAAAILSIGATAELASAQSSSVYVSDGFSEYTERRPNAEHMRYMHPMAGAWSCNIDGRRAWMAWTVPARVNTSCWANGQCQTSATMLEPQGQFIDFGWDGTNRDRANLSGLGPIEGNPNQFQHEDGNTWTLRVTQATYTPTYGIRLATRLEGNTTWNGNAYPLSCDRVSNGGGAFY